MSDEQRARTDAWLRAYGLGERLVDGRRAVGVLARVVAGMSPDEFEEWRLGRMLNRDYLRAKYGIGARRGN